MQVAPEPAAADGALFVAGEPCDDAQLHLHVALPLLTPEPHRVEELRDSRLFDRGQLLDVVEEERSAVRTLDETALDLGGTLEPEEQPGSLALRKPGAVHVHERRTPARIRHPMEPARCADAAWSD